MEGGDENPETIVAYWKDSADADFNTMQHLLASGDFHWALFIGHLVLEKLLKACYVSRHKKHALFTHDLLRLAEKSDVDPTNEVSNWLDEISTFHLNARYDNYKQDFYKRANKEFTDIWVVRITTIREWLMQKL